MLSYGLMQFIQKKKLKGKEAINAFLSDQGITKFTAKQQYKADLYIQEHWDKWASFVDKSIKNGSISGKTVKLCHYYEEKEAEKQRRNNDLLNVNKEALNFAWEIVKLSRKLGDTANNLTNVQRFISLNDIKLPKVNDEGVHPIKRWEPKFKSLIEQGYKEELINQLKQKLICQRNQR